MGPRADGRVPRSMARQTRNRGVEACTCHTPGLKTQIPRQGGVGTFPGDAAAVLQHFRAPNMELFRSHGAAYIEEH